MVESRDRYIRRHNVENYRRQILAEPDEKKREILEKLLSEELQKQLDERDPTAGA